MNANDAGDAVVFIVDDDRRVREALCELLASFDLKAVAFASAGEYLAYPKPDAASCVLLDLELPDINGLDLQSRLAHGNHPHVVFVTGHGDIPSSVRAMKTGAVDFLTKPLVTEHLMRAIDGALAQNREARKKRAQLAELHHRLSRLTPREREVLPLIVSGFLNKQAAAELGISEVTLQIHRSKIMQKMEAASLADLVRMAGILEIPTAQSRHGKR
jgi:FixJ family two-component response regulator